MLKKCNTINLIIETDLRKVLSYVYRSAKFDEKFFNFFARLFILFYIRSEKFRTSVNGKIKKRASEKVEKIRIKLRRS